MNMIIIASQNTNRYRHREIHLLKFGEMYIVGTYTYKKSNIFLISFSYQRI